MHSATSIAFILTLVSLIGCPRPDPPAPPTDDDDTTDTVDDDDATDPDDDDTTDPVDDDDSAPVGDDDDVTVDLLCPDEETPDPVDLTDSDGVATLAFAITEMRLLGELTRFGLIDSEPNCPLSEGDHPTSDSGSLTWFGGCTTKSGAEFQGDLVESWEDSGPNTRSTEDWTVTGTGVNFDVLEFAGTWVEDEADGGIERADTAEGFMRLTGSKRGYLDGTHFPFGIQGSYDWTGDWTDPAQEVHTFTMDAVVICRSAITAAVEVVQTTGVCFSPVPDAGSVQIEADGHVAEIDFSSSTDCSGCWEWTLDGVVQPDPTCSHGF